MQEKNTKFDDSDDSEIPEGHFEVEKICGKKVKGKGIFYLVKWKGYPDSEATWEPAKNLKSA